MLSKTAGIVLQTYKHSDSGVICHILTEEFGLIPFIVKGTHSKKSNTRSAFFQPLQILRLEVYYKPSRNIQSLKEVSADLTLNNLHFDFERSSIAFFIGEILKKTLNENEPNKGLYKYIKESIIHLDTYKNILNFHIGFLIGLMKYIGIAPTHEYSQINCYFDMQNGLYTNSPPLHGYYFDKKFSELLYRFSCTSIEECSSIALSGNIRSEFIESLISYFSMHLQGLNKIKSLDVLKEIFKQ